MEQYDRDVALLEEELERWESIMKERGLTGKLEDSLLGYTAARYIHMGRVAIKLKKHHEIVATRLMLINLK